MNTAIKLLRSGLRASKEEPDVSAQTRKEMGILKEKLINLNNNFITQKKTYISDGHVVNQGNRAWEYLEKCTGCDADKMMLNICHFQIVLECSFNPLVVLKFFFRISRSFLKERCSIGLKQHS